MSETMFDDARKQASNQLSTALAHHTGSEHLYVHAFAKSMDYTDGVRCFADLAGAWWLIDHLLFDPRYKRAALEHNIVFLSVAVDERARAMIECVRDTGEYPLVRHHVRYTDCPVGVWRFYLQANGRGGATLMLPSEY